MSKAMHRNRAFVVQDQQGNEQTLVDRVEFINVGTLNDPQAVIEGSRMITTESGQPVNWLGKGRYQIVLTGQILESGAPEAP